MPSPRIVAHDFVSLSDAGSDDIGLGQTVAVTWTGSATAFITAYSGYWKDSASAKTYCVESANIGTTVTLQSGPAPATLVVLDSSAPASYP